MTANVQGRALADWSPARIFMLVSVLYHVPLGIAGLIVDRSFPFGSAETEAAGSGMVFGIFETNGWHSVAALLLAAVSFYFLLRPRYAREVALALGIQHVALVIAFAVWPPETFSFASNAADQVIHIATAVGGITSALLTPRTLSSARA